MCLVAHENKFGQWIKTTRQNYTKTNGDTGLAIEELAELVGVSHGYISRLERGERAPSSVLVDKIAVVFNTETDWLREMAGMPKVNRSRATSPISSQIIRIVEQLPEDKKAIALSLIKAFYDSNKPPKPNK